MTACSIMPFISNRNELQYPYIARSRLLNSIFFLLFKSIDLASQPVICSQDISDLSVCHSQNI